MAPLTPPWTSNSFRRDRADDRAVRAYGDLLAADVAMDVAVDLEAVLGNDGDLPAENRKVGADDGCSHRAGRREGGSRSRARSAPHRH